MGFSCHQIKIGSKAVNVTFYVRLARHEILTDALFEKESSPHRAQSIL